MWMFIDYLKTLPQYGLPKKGLTLLAGLLANIQQPMIKNWLIRLFIRAFRVNMQEALLEKPEAYPCFNDFFIRHLKAAVRPLGEADILSPVDGTISELGRIENGRIIQAKGRDYTVTELLGDPALAENFEQGVFATLYLSPKDYHRVHMPLRGQLKRLIYLPGQLFSVSPTTARMIPRLFVRNERAVMLFDTAVGPMAMVMVGATIVGAIGTQFDGDLPRSKQSYSRDYDNFPLEKAAELGYFKLGSTVILLFANGQQVNWLEAMKAGKGIQWGESFGTILHE